MLTFPRVAFPFFTHIIICVLLLNPFNEIFILPCIVLTIERYQTIRWSIIYYMPNILYACDSKNKQEKIQ